MIIRKMSEKDVPAAAGLEKLCFSDPWSEKELGECLHKPHYLFLAAEESGTLAGYISAILVLDEADIANLAVDPLFRRRGIGGALLSALLAESRSLGARHFFLEVRESNLPAVSLYEKLGFARIGLRRDYYERPRENALIYGKEEGGA